MSAGLEHPLPRHRRPGLTLYLYVASESLRPALVALLGLTVVVLTTSLLGYAELVVNRGVAAATVGQMLFYQAIPVAGQMFPFAILVGTLVALGRMGADLEIVSLETSGVAAGRLVWPVVSVGGVATVVALLLSVYAAPWAHGRLDDALDEISRTRPWAGLHSGAVERFGGWQLQAREVSAAGDELESVMLFMPELGETIFARRGHVATAEDGSIELALFQGSMMLPAEERLRQLEFETAEVVLPEGGDAFVRTEKDELPGLPLDELAARAAAWQPSERDRLPRAALELQRRFALPAATLVFAFLAVPLFVTRGRYSRASGGVLGLACTLAYYGLVQFSEGLVQGQRLPVAVAGWLPNLAFTLLGGVLLFRVLRERVAGRAFERPQGGRSRWRSGPESETRMRPHPYALPRYVAGRFLELLALSFAVLFTAYLLIDVLDRLEWFARHGATGLEALRFYGARIWLLASRAVPMAILVATALTVSLLAVEGELIGMRACGIPAPRALLPVLFIAALVAPLYFLLNNVVVPRTNALADELKETEIKEDVYREAAEERTRAGFWYRSGGQVFEVAFFDPARGQAREVTIFDLGADGLPTSRTDATRAWHVGGGWWRLSDPSRVELREGRVEQVDAPRHAQLGETVDAEVDTMHLSVNGIAAEARAVEDDGLDARSFWVDYHVRLAEPFGCLVLPAAVLFFAVGGPPFPGPAQTLLVSGVVGVAYILLVAVSSSLGRGGALPPTAGAWGPILAFSLLATWFGMRVWRRL